MNKQRVGYLLLSATGILLLATGWTDLDWMVNAYKWDMWNGSAEAGGLWWFNTWFALEWWTAFEFTLARIISGSVLLGWLAAKIHFK